MFLLIRKHHLNIWIVSVNQFLDRQLLIAFQNCRIKQVRSKEEVLTLTGPPTLIAIDAQLTLMKLSSAERASEEAAVRIIPTDLRIPLVVHVADLLDPPELVPGHDRRVMIFDVVLWNLRAVVLHAFMGKMIRCVKLLEDDVSAVFHIFQNGMDQRRIPVRLSQRSRNLRLVQFLPDLWCGKAVLIFIKDLPDDRCLILDNDIGFIAFLGVTLDRNPAVCPILKSLTDAPLNVLGKGS